MYLNCHTYYSLRYGTFTPEALVSRAAALGIESLVLTDINCTTGIFEFVKRCRDKGIHPVAGIEFRRDQRLLFAGIASDTAGFRELNEFLSHHTLNHISLPDRAPVFNHAFVVYPFGQVPAGPLREHERIGVSLRDLSRLPACTAALIRSCVVFQPVTVPDREGYELHRQLRAVAHNKLLLHLPPEVFADAGEILHPPQWIEKQFESYPAILRNTKEVLRSCTFSFDFSTIKNKKHYTGNGADDKLLLEKLASDGMKYRYGEGHKVAEARIRNELEIIEKLGFSSYFLITWDIIRYSLNRGFYHVGRGSGANSVVAYCLRITDVCPIELDLYFERFLNPKRKSPPDFDIDYSWKDRDEVIDYIFKRYGKKHTALLGTISTFRDRSIPRELGKVHGLPKPEIDRHVRGKKGQQDADPVTALIESSREALEDFPNMRSIHAGGILISEEPITAYTALDLPPKNFPTTQFDMYIAEDIGFEKLDILSQRGIGHIQEAVEIIFKNQGTRVDVYRVDLFKEDRKVKAQLRSGRTIGCFYVESPAMRGLLHKLRCDNYLSLVAASSIIRPGVASSGMMREYIQRFHHPNGFQYLHPILKEQLQETFGVMVYQEDVLKVCHHFGGLDLADADVLRRMMSGKGKNKQAIESIREKFFLNGREKNFDPSVTAEVWRQIESFAGYSFSKAHSASYAVESFQSLFLKTYFPMEFMVAVINNFGGFYSTRVYVNEARKSGAVVHLPCVNHSRHFSSITGADLYLGFVHVQDLEQEVIRTILSERERSGLFTGLEDFMLRTQTRLAQMIILIRLGALRFTGLSKKAMLWEAHLFLHREDAPAPERLFVSERKAYALPSFDADPVEDLYDETEFLGFTVSRPVFDLLKTNFRGEIRAGEMGSSVGRKVRMVGSFVHAKYVRTKRGEIMHFGTFLDDMGDFFDTVHFPNSLRHSPFTGPGIYLVLGLITEEFGFPSMTVHRMAKLPVKPDPRSD